MVNKKIFNSELIFSVKLNEMLVVAEEKYDKKVSTFIKLLAFTGMRVAELNNLKFSDFNEVGNIIFISGVNGKREVVLTQQIIGAVTLLKKSYPHCIYLFQSPNEDKGVIPLSPRYLSGVFRKIVDISKSPIKISSFRQLYVTALVKHELSTNDYFT
jgi:integrase